MNGEGAEVGELMKSKVNKKAAEDKKAAEEAVQKRLDDMKNKAANDDDGVKDQDSKSAKVSKDSKDSVVSKDSNESKPVGIVEPKSESAVVPPKKKKKKVAKAEERAKEEVAEVPKVDVVQDPPKENSEARASIVDKVISEMAEENQPKNRLAVVDRDPAKGEPDNNGKREWSPTPAPRTRRQRSPLTPLIHKAGSLLALRNCIETVNTMGPRLHERASVARGSQDAGSRNLGPALCKLAAT